MRKHRMSYAQRFVTSVAALCLTLIMCASASAAGNSPYTVGYIASLTGGAASLGVPQTKGLEAGYAEQSVVHGRKIRLIKLDGQSDPSAVARNVRRLINEDKVDVIIGGSVHGGTVSATHIAATHKVPMIATDPIEINDPKRRAWVVEIPQPLPLIVDVIVERMQQDGVKTVGYIGYAGEWGDEVYNALLKSAQPYGIKVIADERYARTDTSVTGQMLRIMSKHPDAVMDGGTGTPGALPLIALANLGYKGRIYGTHALISPAFVKIGGDAVNGLVAPTGPEVVASQLGKDDPNRKVILAYHAAYQKQNGVAPTSAFAAYGYDAWLVFLNAARRVPAKYEPGTQEFRSALRAALKNTRNVVGTEGTYSFGANDLYGVRRSSVVVVKLEHGKWILLQDKP